MATPLRSYARVPGGLSWVYLPGGQCHHQELPLCRGQQPLATDSSQSEGERASLRSQGVSGPMEETVPVCRHRGCVWAEYDGDSGGNPSPVLSSSVRLPDHPEQILWRVPSPDTGGPSRCSEGDHHTQQGGLPKPECRRTAVSLCLSPSSGLGPAEGADSQQELGPAVPDLCHGLAELPLSTQGGAFAPRLELGVGSIHGGPGLSSPPQQLVLPHRTTNSTRLQRGLESSSHCPRG